MLKEQILDLLEKDREFRYAVAGLIGLQEILQRLDRHEEIMQKMLERLDRHEEEIKRLWEEVRALRENQEKMWQSQEKMWQNQEKLWQEVRLLRENQEKMLQNQEKLWQNQEKMWQNQEKLWEEVRALREGQNRLERELKRTRNYMMKGFREIKSVLGTSFHGSAAAFVEFLLAEMGYDARVDRKILVHEGEAVEMDLFSDRPLLLGEVTLSLESEKAARDEFEKLMRKAKIIEKLFGKPEFMFLVVSKASKEAEDPLRKLCAEKV